MVLVYAAPKLNSSLATNVLFVQLEDVEEVLSNGTDKKERTKTK